MKGTENMKKKLSTRLLSGVSALLLATAVLLPSSTSADAASETLKTIDGKTTTDKTVLLVGEKSPDKGDKFADTVKNLEDKYLLGVASEFSVFLKNDFTVKESDTEGRAAIGGNLVDNTGWDYEIGKGEADTQTPIDYLLDNSNYANIVIGGSMNNQISDKYYGDSSQQSKKKLVLQAGGSYDKDLIPEAAGDLIDRTQTYLANKNELVDFGRTFTLIEERSKLLAEKSADGKVEFNESGDTVTFTYTGTAKTAECVYFDLTDKQLEAYKKAINVEFVNIPKLPTPRTIITTTPVSTSTWDYAYIVVNIKGEGSKDTKNENAVIMADVNNNNGEKFTKINGTYVSRDPANNDEKPKNNKPGTDSIIYNLPDATKVVLVNNFQGSILAPKAHVTDYAYEYKDQGTDPRGHLSGALIADSFSGSTQFTFRTCRLPFSILSKDLYFNKQWINCDSSTEFPSEKVFKQHLTVQKTVGGVTSSLVEDIDYTVELSNTTSTTWSATVHIKSYDPSAIYKVNESKLDNFEIVEDSVYLAASAEGAEALINSYEKKTTSPEVSSVSSKPEVSSVSSEPEVSSVSSEPEVSSVSSEPEVSSVSSEPEVSSVSSEPEVSSVSSEPEVSTPSKEPEVTTPTSNVTTDVDNDGDDNNKTTTTANPSGVGDGGDNNDKETGTGSDGDNNNPMTGIKLSALMLSAVSLAAAVAASKKKK